MSKHPSGGTFGDLSSHPFRALKPYVGSPVMPCSFDTLPPNTGPQPLTLSSDIPNSQGYTSWPTDVSMLVISIYPT